MLLYPLSFTYQPRNELEEREVRTNKIDKIKQSLRAVSLFNSIASGNRENQVKERTRGRVLTQAKEHYYVSLEQEAHSVEATQINLAERICAVANYLERSISR